jgi:hypothetical protein
MVLKYQSASTTMQSSVTQYGITWTFDKAYPVGQFVNGDYFVVGSEVKVIGFSPASEIVSDTYRNGSMVNPENYYQGFDSRPTGGTTGPEYSHALNVAYGVTSEAPLTLTPNDSLVSSISKATLGTWNSYIHRYAVLTVLATTPEYEAFRPPFVNVDKTRPYSNASYTWSDVKTELLQNLTVVGTRPTWASAEQRILQPYLWYQSFYGGGRGVAWGDSDPDVQAVADYGREIAGHIGTMALMINSDAPIADKKLTVAGLIQRGIDDWGIYRCAVVENERNFPWHPDGNIYDGHKLPILLAGVLLDDSEMKAVGSISYMFHEDAQVWTVTQDDVGRTLSAGKTEYSQSHVGMPEWGVKHATQPAEDNSSWDQSYRAGHISYHGIMLAPLIMGLKTLYNHDVAFDYMHRYQHIAAGEADPFGYEVTNETSGNRGDWDRWWAGSGTWSTAMYDEYWDDYYTMPV